MMRSSGAKPPGIFFCDSTVTVPKSHLRADGGATNAPDVPPSATGRSPTYLVKYGPCPARVRLEPTRGGIWKRLGIPAP